VFGVALLAVVGPTAGRWYADVTSGVLYWAIVEKGGQSIWWATLIAFAVGYTLRVLALYRGWEEPLVPEPAGVYRHDDGRPLLGRKIAGKSRRELRDLGLLVENGDSAEASRSAKRQPTGVAGGGA